MDQTAHKLVVNPEQSGGIIAVGAKSPRGENLQFTVTTEAQQRQGRRGSDQARPQVSRARDAKFSPPPPRRSPPHRHSPPPRHSPPRHGRRSPAPRQRSYASDMYSSDEGSPPPMYHGSPSFDVSGLANPNKMRRDFREHLPVPLPDSSTDAPGPAPFLNPARPRPRPLKRQRSNRAQASPPSERKSCTSS